MKKSAGLRAIGALGVVALTLSSGAAQNGTLQTIPSAYNPGEAPVRITAAWQRQTRSEDPAPSTHPLILKISETVAFPPGAAAKATVSASENLKVRHLAFDHKIDTYCTNGSPRWDVETTDGNSYTFGCAAGVRQVDLPAPGWERITFSCTDVQVLKGPPGSCPLGTAQTVAALQIVHDEAGSTTLDNLDVNWTVMSGPGPRP